MKILFVAAREVAPATELLFREMLMGAASIPPDWVGYAHLEGGRGVLWTLIKEAKPPIILAEGREVAKVLLKGRSTFKLDPLLHTPQSVTYCESIIVPLNRLSQTLRKGKLAITEVVQTLVKVRNEVNKIDRV